jgi:hypothetical protein
LSERILLTSGGKRTNGSSYFEKHQNPHKNEITSTIPAPDLYGTSTVQTPDEHTSAPADSLLLIPESPLLNPETNIGAKAPLGQAPLTAFDEFWESYPRKVKRKDALKVWNTAKLDKHANAIMSALSRFIESAEWHKNNGEFIPHPTTWLHARRWEDEVPPPISKNPYLDALKGCVFE